MSPLLSTILLVFSLVFYICYSKEAVIVGGNLDDNNQQIYSTFVQSTFRGKNSYIGLITASSEDPLDSAQFYTKILTDFGAPKIEWIPITINYVGNNSNPEVLAKISQMTAFFFSGGDQLRYVQSFYLPSGNPSPALSLILQKYANNEVSVAGTSAGSDIQQGPPLVTGGESYDALVYGSFPHDDPKHPDRLSYYPKGGFSLSFPAEYGLLDTHFGVRGRLGRMIRLACDTQNSKMVYGIDENTAMHVQDGVFKVMGEHGIFIFDLTWSQVSKKPNFEVRNVSVHYLTQDDAWDLQHKLVQFASWKSNIKGQEQHDYPLKSSLDIFSSANNLGKDGHRKNPNEFTKISTDLFDSSQAQTTHGFSYEQKPTPYRVELSKEAAVGFVGMYNSTRFISYANLKMNIIVDTQKRD